MNRPSSKKKPMRLPRYFVRYQNDFILVADQDNDRILMVSPDLEPVREFITRDIRKPVPDVSGRKRKTTIRGRRKPGIGVRFYPKTGNIIVLIIYR